LISDPDADSLENPFMSFENDPSPLPPAIEPPAPEPMPQTPFEGHRYHPRVKLVWRLVILGVVLLVVLMIGMNWLMEAFLHSRGEVVIPQLNGKTVVEALDILSKAGLTLTQDEVEFNESMPPGAILRQRPAAGMRVRHGRVVHVTVSKGGQSLFVPDVANKSVSDAQTAISSAGLILGEVSEVYSTIVPRALVVSQIPKASDVAAKGSMVDLQVSKGPPPDDVKLMPDFRNRSLDEVRSWAKQENYTLGVQQSTTTMGLSGVVLQQDPQPDQQLEPGMMIKVTVSSTHPQESVSAAAVHLRYEVPQGTDKVQIRMVARDESGEHEIFKGQKNSGETIDLPMAPTGPTRVRIFVNDVLMDEQIVGEKKP